MAVEVEIDPGVGAAAFRAAQPVALELARGGKVVHREGKVEQGHGAHGNPFVGRDVLMCR